jgi:hypothetical protein
MMDVAQETGPLPQQRPSFEWSIVMRMIAAALVCLGLAHCAGPPTGERLTGEAFIALVRGNTMDGRGQDGGAFRTYVTPDLEQRGAAQLPNGTQWRYGGTIRATDNGFCSQSPQLRGGQERCFEVWRDGTTFRTYWNGAPWTTMTIRPGNPHAL